MFSGGFSGFDAVCVEADDFADGVFRVDGLFFPQDTAEACGQGVYDALCAGSDAGHEECFEDGEVGVYAVSFHEQGPCAVIECADVFEPQAFDGFDDVVGCVG